jgi:hypothetical protein
VLPVLVELLAIQALYRPTKPFETGTGIPRPDTTETQSERWYFGGRSLIVSRRPPISLDTVVARPRIYTYGAKFGSCPCSRTVPYR